MAQNEAELDVASIRELEREETTQAVIESLIDQGIRFDLDLDDMWPRFVFFDEAVGA